MFDQILSIIAPHRCYECGKTGYILCQSCKKYIIKQRFQLCILCGNSLKTGNLCDNHRQPYDMLWCFEYRRGSIAKIIDDYKFRRVRAAAGVLGDLLDSALPELPADAVIVPIPTTSRNMRRRGYDHMRLIAKDLARKRKVGYSSLLRRRNNVVQHATRSSRQRKRQAKEFFEISQSIDQNKLYVIIDDIFTTGSTLAAAADCLRQAGAENVQAAVITRHGNI